MAPLGFSTRAIHAGQNPDPTSGAVTVPISLASTFAQKTPGQAVYDYSRSGNPTRAAFEAQVAAIENGRYGLAFASGSAVTATIMNLLEPGAHIITVDDVYGGTNRYFNRVAKPNMHITIDFVDFSKTEKIEEARKENTKMLWLETPTNPTLKIADIRSVTEWAKKHNIVTVVDNTFASPFLQNPLDLGADIVMHSVTKYLGGHSDVVMGVLVTSNEELYTKLKFLQNSIGAVPSPFDCYMAMRGIKTLAVRMREHCKNAQHIAEFLEAHPLVERVIYPGLKSHPQYDLAQKQMRGGGGMITFFLKGGLAESKAFLENLHLFALAESLGAVESLAEHPAIMTHASVPPEHRKLLGISDSLIRLSVGIENVEDLIDDLKGAFAAASRVNVA